MTVSIVLTTYNGEKYLLPLLESIKNQTEYVDEVLVSDDKSSDDTVNIVSDFIIKYGLKTWKLNVNDTNLGFKKNFLLAMSRAKGDLIFPCDQDDLWYPNKINAMKRIMDKYNNIQVSFCDSVAYDDSVNISNFENFNDADIERIPFSEEVRNCYGAGHLLCVRKQFIEQYSQEIIKHCLTFDIPYCLIASKLNGFYKINQILVARRFHENNTSGATRFKLDSVKNRKRIIDGRKTRLEYFKFLIKIFGIDAFDSEYIEFLKIFSLSLNGIEERKLWPLVAELFTNNKYINRLYTVAGIIGIVK